MERSLIMQKIILTLLLVGPLVPIFVIVTSALGLIDWYEFIQFLIRNNVGAWVLLIAVVLILIVIIYAIWF